MFPWELPTHYLFILFYTEQQVAYREEKNTHFDSILLPIKIRYFMFEPRKQHKLDK